MTCPHCLRAVKALGLLATALYLLCFSPAALADSNSAIKQAESAQSQLWLFSTRCIPDLGCGVWANARVDVRRLNDDCVWTHSTLDEFYADDDPHVVTVFYVHGNRFTFDDAVQRGWEVYQRLKQRGCGGPIRLVIWSWPSDPLLLPLKDIRVKAMRSDADGVLLAWVLARLSPDVPIGLLGHSLGARVVTGALHVLGGGDLCGRRIPPQLCRTSRCARVVLSAAALDDHWLVPGHYHGRALTQIDRMLLLNNAYDPALKRYHWLRMGSRPEALGLTGMAGREWLDDETDWRIVERDVRYIVGASHNEQCYIFSPEITDMVCDCFGRSLSSFK